MQHTTYKFMQMPDVQVLTEGDAFTMAFHDPIAATAWVLDTHHITYMFMQ